VIPAILMNVLFVLVTAGMPAQGQAPVYAQTRSPHGPLNLPCTNCHTTLGWKPIRGIPEFDHNQTKFPLRGMHQGVMCTQCHIKPVFSNWGRSARNATPISTAARWGHVASSATW
jgi:hypothetical protein